MRVAGRRRGEELLTDVLDLDAVDAGPALRHRRRLPHVGADRSREGPGIELPMYGGPVREPSA